MSTNVTNVSSHFPEAENGFTTTLASTISAAATIVPLNSVAGYTNGKPAVFVVDPSDPLKKQTFTGIIDTAGVQVTDVIWTAGSNQTHTAGATVVDYATATHISMISKGIAVEHKQSGKHSDITADSATITNATITNLTVGTQAAPADYNSQAVLPTSIAYNGQRSYTLTYPSSVATFKSPGQRNRLVRTVAAPTQCASLNGTTQYFSCASANLAEMSFTDDFVVDAYVKMTSYVTSGIVSRFNNTSGWSLRINSSGQVFLFGNNAGGSNFTGITSYQSIPLNKWVRITAQLDMNTATTTPTTNYVMIDGIDVPCFRTQGGTNPTALVQAGNLEVGSESSGTAPFPGKIAQVAIYGSKVTQANIRLTHSQGLTGSESGLISAYSLSNSLNDLNLTSANNLTAQGSATATNADSPFGNSGVSSTVEYGITMSVASDGLSEVIQVPEGCAIPTSGGVSGISYSGLDSPYGFPKSENKWDIEYKYKTQISQVVTSTSAWLNHSGIRFDLPVGVFEADCNLVANSVATSVAYLGCVFTISTANNTQSHDYLTGYPNINAVASIDAVCQEKINGPIINTVATTWYLNTQPAAVNGTTTNKLRGDVSQPAIFKFKNAYL